jgi:hypothetical protein
VSFGSLIFITLFVLAACAAPTAMPQASFLQRYGTALPFLPCPHGSLIAGIGAAVCLVLFFV